MHEGVYCENDHVPEHLDEPLARIADEGMVRLTYQRDDPRESEQDLA